MLFNREKLKKKIASLKGAKKDTYSIRDAGSTYATNIIAQALTHVLECLEPEQPVTDCHAIPKQEDGEMAPREVFSYTVQVRDCVPPNEIWVAPMSALDLAGKQKDVETNRLKVDAECADLYCDRWQEELARNEKLEAKVKRYEDALLAANYCMSWEQTINIIREALNDEREDA